MADKNKGGRPKGSRNKKKKDDRLRDENGHLILTDELRAEGWTEAPEGWKTAIWKPLDTKYQQGDNNRKYTNEQIVEALRLAKGNVALTARALGYSAKWIYKRIKSSGLQGDLDEIRANNVACAENELYKLIYNPEVRDDVKLNAVKFYLSNQGRAFGWGNEVSFNVEGTIEHKHSANEQVLDDLLEKFEDKLIETDVEVINDD